MSVGDSMTKGRIKTEPSTKPEDYCKSCGHSLNEHFQNIQGNVVCLHSSIGQSTGVIMNYMDTCTCFNLIKPPVQDYNYTGFSDEFSFTTSIADTVDDIVEWAKKKMKEITK